MALIVGAKAATLKAMLYNLRADDPVTIAAVGALLVLVALAACLVPAQRATSWIPWWP